LAELILTLGLRLSLFIGKTWLNQYLIINGTSVDSILMTNSEEPFMELTYRERLSDKILSKT